MDVNGPHLSVVIVNWNQADLLRACLESVGASELDPPATVEVIVVDNGSQDGSRAMLSTDFGDHRVLAQETNLGFARGANLGMRAARAPLILLLNNDATVAPGCLAALLSAAERHPEAGAFAAKMLFAEGQAINSAGITVDTIGVAADRLLGAAPDQGSEEVEVFGASAGAVVLRRSLLDDVGQFEEAFGMYLEDVDLAWRARAAGWRTVYVPEAVVHHHHSVSSRHRSPRKHWLVGRNRVWLLARNMPTGHLLRSLPAILVYDAALVAFVLVRERTASPLRGRLAGLRTWSAVRRRPDDRAALDLAPRQGIASALRRHATWERRSGGLGG